MTAFVRMSCSVVVKSLSVKLCVPFIPLGVVTPSCCREHLEGEQWLEKLLVSEIEFESGDGGCAYRKFLRRVSDARFTR